MAVNVESEFTLQLLQFLHETFEKPVGIFLDPNTSLFQTLETVTAGQASIPVGGKCASLAAQVSHVIFYIENFENYAIRGDPTPPDWGHVWKTVEQVTPAQWDSLRQELKDAYSRITKLFEENTLWDGDRMGGALSIVVHSAYHLGEIRQALCQVV
jgi:hypothetical protein